MLSTIALLSTLALSPAQDLVLPLPGRVDPYTDSEGRMLESRVVSIDQDALGDLLAAPGTAVELELFEAESVTLVSRGVLPGFGADTWTAGGSLGGQAFGTFALVSLGGRLFADIVTDGGDTFRLRPIGSGRHAIRRMDLSGLPECGTADEESWPPPPAAGQDEPLQLLSASVPSVHVLVVYTNLVADQLEGEVGGLESGHLLACGDIELGFVTANLAYADSDVNAELKLVGIMNVDYSEAGEAVDTTGKTQDQINKAYDDAFSFDLNAMVDDDDGILDEIHAWRDIVGADLVSMVIKNEGHCGLAKALNEQPSASTDNKAWNVIRYTCVSTTTLAHETGHNLGCAHDHVASTLSQGSYDFSFGHHFEGTDQKNYRTLMAYELKDLDGDQIKVARFSNPTLNYKGTPTGVGLGDGAAWNSLSINCNAVTVATYRQAKSPMPVVWVDAAASGSAAQDGLWTAPFSTMQKGLLAVKPGGTILVVGGSSLDPPVFGYKEVTVEVVGSGVAVLQD